MEDPKPIGDSIPDALLNIINSKAAIDKRDALNEERKAREKEIKRRFRGAERQKRLDELAEEVKGRLRQIVEELIGGVSSSRGNP